MKSKKKKKVGRKVLESMGLKHSRKQIKFLRILKNKFKIIKSDRYCCDCELVKWDMVEDTSPALQEPHT